MPAKHEGDLSTYDKRFVRCRGMRQHTWQFATDFNVTTGPGGRVIEFTRTVKCAMCTTSREDRVKVHRNGSFEFMGRRYVYADGYQVSKHNPIPVDAARDALFMEEMRQALDIELFQRVNNQRILGEKDRKALAPKKNVPAQRGRHLKAVVADAS
jgi:hypothetical protein